MALTAKAAVSWPVPTLTQPVLLLISYTPYGTARFNLGSMKSCTLTSSGVPLGLHSRPAFLKLPTNSFFFVSTEMTGWPSVKKLPAFLLMFELTIPVHMLASFVGFPVGL